MNNLNKWIPTIITIVGGLISGFTPQIQQYFTNHPTFAVGLATSYALLKGFLPSPFQK